MQNTSTQKIYDSMHEARAAIPTPEEVDRGFDQMRNDLPGSIMEFTSIKTPEEYATMKGIKVAFKGENGNVVQGRLIQWGDDYHFRVIGFDKNVLVTKVYMADELYKMPENESLKGAVDYCRAHENEVTDSRSQVGGMLKTIAQFKQENKVV